MPNSMDSVLNQTTIPMSVTAQNCVSQSANVVMKDIPLDLKMLMDARVSQSSTDMNTSKLHPGQIVTSVELQAVSATGGIPSPSMDDYHDSDGGLSSSTSVHITDLHPHHHHHAVSATIINVPDIHGSAEPSPPPPHNTHSNHHHQHHSLTELSSAAPHISIQSHTNMKNVGLKQQEHSHQSAVLTQASMSSEQLYASDAPASVLHGSSSNNSHMQEQQSNVATSMSLQAILDCNSSTVGGLQQPHLVTMPSNVVHLQGGTNTAVNTSLLSYSMSSSPMLQVSSASSSGDSMVPQSSYLTDQSRTDAQHDSSAVEYQLVTTLPYSHHDVNSSHIGSETTYSLPANNLNSTIRVSNNINNTPMATTISTSNSGSSNCITPVVTQMAGAVDMSGTDILQNALNISTNTVASSQPGSVTSNMIGGTIMHTNVNDSGIRYNHTNKQLVSQVIYRCFQCDSSFVSKKSLEDHMSSHAETASQSSTQEMLTAASKEMDPQIMVMLNPIASSQPDSYESASPHLSYHLTPTTTNNTVLQRPITSSHHMQHQLQQHPITVQHVQEHQQIVLQPHSEATNINSCNKSRDYCGEDATVSQLQQQQLYTVHSGQYQEQQQQHHNNNNNSVLITVPRNALTGNADINSMNSKNNVSVSNGGNICYQQQQQQQQQQHHKGRRITATTSGGEVISVVTCASGGGGGGEATTTYVVASTDLHELQQSGGQLLLQKEDQQQQETHSHGRGLNQRQVQQQQQHARMSLSRFITTSEANISESQQNLEPHQGHIKQQTGVLCVNSNNKNGVLSNSKFQQRQQHQFTDTQQQQEQQQQITLDVSSSRHALKSLEPDMIGVAPAKPHRPYKCDKCTASFIELFECEEHRRKHSGDGPFTCEDCHFSFMYKSHFKSHKTRCEKKRAKMPTLTQASAAGISIIREFPTHQTINTTAVLTGGSVGGGRGGVHGQRRRGNARRNLAVITDTVGHANDVYFKVESQGDDQVHLQKQLQQQQQSQQQQQPQQQQQQLLQQQQVLDQHHNQLELRGHDISGIDRLQQNNLPPTPRRNNASNRGGHRKNASGATTITINIKTQSSEVNTFNPMQPSFKRFKQQNNQLRPFECDLCDASFTTSDDLASHKMKHSSDGPFRCDGCRVLYLYRRLYDAHKRKCKRGRSKRDGPVGMGGGQTIQESQQQQQQLQESEQQMHAALDQQSNHGQQVTVQQQQQVISVQQQHQTQCQQEQPQQIIFIEQQQIPQIQQQTKMMQQHHSDNHHQPVQQLDLSSLASSGSIIALQPHPLHQQQVGGVGNSVGGMQQFQIQTLGPGGLQVVDGSLLELRGQQLVAVTDGTSLGRAAGGGGQVKYEIVQAVDADSVPQIMNLIKKSGGGGGGTVATAQ